MGRSAKVTSIETLERLKEALCAFSTEGRDALSAVDIQVRRTADWLNERQKFWQKEIRERQDAVVRAKIELEQRKFENRDGKGRGYTEQQVNLRKAQEHLKEAEQKLANCKRWQPQLQHAMMEYQGPSRMLATTLEADLKHAVALLENKLAALEAYLKLNPPPAPGPATVSSSAEPALVESAAVASVAVAPPEAVPELAPPVAEQEAIQPDERAEP